jgi:hypothetical protein
LRVEARSFGYDRRLAPPLDGVTADGATTRVDTLVILFDDDPRISRRDLLLQRRQAKS